MGCIIIRIVAGDCIVVAGSYPTPCGISRVRHFFKWYPTSPIVAFIGDLKWYQAVSARADGQAAGCLPSVMPVDIGIDKIQHNEADVPEAFPKFAG